MITNTTPQRSLRGHRPKRLSQRAAIGGEYVARLAGRLTDRDRWLARMLYEHRVLTTTQITQLAWSSVRAANLRLLQLYKWRVLDRFQPFVTYGSAPMHYVLDVAGAAVLAREEGLDPRELNYRQERAIGIAHSLRLAHIVATNTFFTTLIHRSRHSDSGGRLTAWWSEARCLKLFGDVVRPDAYGRWREGQREIEWFLEYDWGTERPADRVGGKLPGYAKLAATTGITTPVLLWMPTGHREARVRRALAASLALLDDPSLVPLATTSADFVHGEGQSDPSLARWLPLNTEQTTSRRLPLAELNGAWPHLPPLSASPASAVTSADTAGRSRSPLPPQLPRPPIQPRRR
ncbi:replication-relaxation family protein [Streptomyces sp. NBC_00079]|uniref:replication-relaxation family protein n=1 Tax=Streptomyces sp. NBC_00079 TaxID=2975644 RepID=UPI0032534BB3